MIKILGWPKSLRVWYRLTEKSCWSFWPTQYMLMDTNIAFRVKKTPFHDLSDEAPTTPPASSHSLILSLSPPHVGGTFGLSFAQALPYSWDCLLFFLFHASLRYLCKHPFFQSSFPELCVQPTITMVHRLYDPLCSNNHNCDLIIVCVVIWQNSIRA